MTEEQFNILAKHEQTLQNARNNFARAISTQTVQELDKVYKELIPNKPSKITSGCSRCVLNALRDLAELYFKEKEGRVEAELEPTPTEEPTVKKKKNKATNKE